MQSPDSTCGTWQEFRDKEHRREWEAEHRELTGHGLDDSDRRRLPDKTHDKPRSV